MDETGDPRAQARLRAQRLRRIQNAALILLAIGVAILVYAAIGVGTR